MIIVCYDGSADAQAATDRVTMLFPEKPATVLTVWERYAEMLVGAGFGLAYDPIADATDVDTQLLERARQTADERAQRLRAAGLSADARVEERETSIARTVLAVARHVDAEAIVVGTRGRGGVKSALLGSVSHDLVQHADRAVVVVPSAALAGRREEW
jgi:nucleotide-binding universal stress UspA family protein